jgi:hypothetical protein
MDPDETRKGTIKLGVLGEAGTLLSPACTLTSEGVYPSKPS